MEKASAALLHLFSHSLSLETQINSEYLPLPVLLTKTTYFIAVRVVLGEDTGGKRV